MQVNIFGSSFDAIIASVCLAEYGNAVTVLSSSEQELFSKHWVANEPGLLPKLISNVEQSRLSFGDSAQGSLMTDKPYYWFFERESVDLFSEIKEVVIHGAPKAIIISSHHSIGYVGNLKERLDEYCLANGISTMVIAVVPFSAREGNGLRDFEYPELIILGCDGQPAQKKVEQLLYPFIKQAKNYLPVALTEAELIRSSIAAMLATRLSFVNELASLCETIGADIETICQAMGFDPRVGPGYLAAGCGFGGQTLPTELENLREKLGGGAGAQLLSAVQKTNEHQKELMFRKLWQYYGADIQGKKVAIWGGAFKAGVSNTENSSIHPLLNALRAQGVNSHVFDPLAGLLLEQYSEHDLIEIENNAYEVLRQADALVIVTDHKEFLSPDFDQIKSLMKQPVIFDGRNIYAPDHMKELGIEYYGIGHGLTL